VSSPVLFRSCPKCASPLQPKTHYGVELDLCLKCKGVWFDATELSTALFGPAKKPTAYTAFFDESKLRPVATKGQTCPVCLADTLSQALWGEVSAAKCLLCHGVWISAQSLIDLRTQLGALQAPKDHPILTQEERQLGWGLGIEVLQVLAELFA